MQEEMAKMMFISWMKIDLTRQFITVEIAGQRYVYDIKNISDNKKDFSITYKHVDTGETLVENVSFKNKDTIVITSPQTDARLYKRTDF